MRNKHYIPILAIISVLGSSCASTVKITSVAEKNSDGQFLLKWEVFPEQEGKIEIYSSPSDSSMTAFTAVKSTNVIDQVAIIDAGGSDLREFFVLRTSGVYSGIVSNRIIEMSSIKNFRDAGGYFTMDNQQMRWGKIFRSGDLSSVNLYDQEKIRRLGIKTVIDLRSEENAKTHPILLHPSIRRIALPILTMDVSIMEKHTNNKNFTRSDAIRYVQDSYISILEEEKEKFADMFDILIDDANYPVLLAGALGKDRVGLATFLILSALGIPENVIMDDYLISNRTIDPKTTIDYAQTLPEYLQEAVTALLSVNRVYLEYAIDYIKQKYGSVDNYLQRETKVTSGKRTLLRKHLLYNP